MDRIDFNALGDALLRDAESLLAQWFPHGTVAGHEFKIGSIAGEAGDSLSINMTTGRWADFASEHKGGDLISLYAAHRGLSQLDAARELSGEAARMLAVLPARPKAPRSKQKWTPVLPVPSDAPAPPDRFARKEGERWVPGEFIRRWTYHDADGLVLGHAERYEWPKVDAETGRQAVDSETGELQWEKDVVPRTWCKHDETGRSAWRTRSFPVPRPLYGLRELAERPTAPVLIVEGEKSVDAARQIAPQYVVITWPGGAEAWRKAALNPLRGHPSVLLWPDADEPGTKAMWEVGHALLQLVPTVKIILPTGKPDGWDAADALAEGWGWREFKEWALPLATLITETGAQDGASDTGGPEPANESGAGRGAGAAAQAGDRAHGAQPGADERADAGAAGGADAAAQGAAADHAVRSVGALAGGTLPEAGRVRPGADGAPQADERAGPDDRRPAPGHRGDQPGRPGDDQRPAGPDWPPGGEAGPVAADPEHQPGGAAGLRELPAGDGGRAQAAPGAAGALAAPAGQAQSQVSRWLAWGLDRNGNGIPLTNLNNAVAILENDPHLQGLVWFDEFLQRMLTGDPAREWTEADDINLTLYMQRALGTQKMGVDTVRQAVKAIAYRNVKNCVRDWLGGLAWDRSPRIEMFFIDIFGAEDTPYTRAAGRNFWISIAARALNPGCQVDNMVVLEGYQGIQKSSALQIIGGDWYAAQHESPTNMRAFAEILQGKIVIEIEEMHAFSRVENEAVKKAVTVRKDRFRPSGAHGYAKDHPRTCIFAGTTNRDDWNKDETGARRQWPIRCAFVQLELLRASREQYFAEAVAIYRRVSADALPAARIAADAAWWVMPDEETKAEQQERYDADPWMDVVARFVGLLPSVTIEEVMQEALKIEVARFTRSDQMRVAACLRVLGWVKKDTRRGNRIIKVWRMGSESVSKVATSGEVATGSNAQVVDSEIPF